MNSIALKTACNPINKVKLNQVKVSPLFDSLAGRVPDPSKAVPAPALPFLIPSLLFLLFPCRFWRRHDTARFHGTSIRQHPIDSRATLIGYTKKYRNRSGVNDLR